MPMYMRHCPLTWALSQRRHRPRLPPRRCRASTFAPSSAAVWRRRTPLLRVVGMPHGPPFGALLVTVVLSLAACATELTGAELAVEYYNLGNAYLELDRFEPAIGYYRRSLRLRDDAETRFNLALALERSGRFDDSLAEIATLLAAEPANALVLELQAMALHSAGRDREAIATYVRIEALDPENDIAPYNRALIHWGIGETAEAVGILEGLFSRDPEDQDTLFNLALLSSQMEQLADALDLWRQYLEAAPTDTGALLELAVVQSKMQQFGAALESYAAAEATMALDDPRAAGAQFERAAILLTEVEDPRAGLAALRAALVAGYRDRDRIANLVARPDLLERDTVLAELRERNLEPPEEGAEVQEVEGQG